MYRVLVNEKEGRILVTGKEEDLRLLEEGWDLVFESFDWDEAFDFAMDMADDEIIEWYYEDAVKKKFITGLSVVA
ncbi:MAG: hypothetical protein JHC20_04025 [Pyrobaculum sp.]|jgi:hypothetical protein|nr:hypothetical protein [Pyrobaculum sp.]